ncbi:MAG: ParB/RepB/Spo0J family partition protein, partial [Arcobacteraceae bacterium]
TGVSDFMELELSLVYPNPAQPRKAFSDIEELSSSIKKSGLIQPVAVTKDGSGKYMIISGERRYRACTLLELKTIKCHIISASSKDIEEMSLVENIQRSDLTDFEIANFITALWNSEQYEKKQDLANALGKSSTYISKALGLVEKLDDSIKDDLQTNKSDLGLSVLEEVSRLKDKDTQKEVYEKVKNKEITRADIRDYKESNIPGKSFSKSELENAEQTEIQVDENFAGENESIIYKFLVQIFIGRKITDRKLYLEEMFEATTKDEALELAHKKYKKEKKNDDFKFFVYLDSRVHKKKEGKTIKLSKTGVGFGTVNHIGTYVCIVDGDFKGTFEFESGGEFMKTTNNKEYKITIEEV